MEEIHRTLRVENKPIEINQSCSNRSYVFRSFHSFTVHSLSKNSVFSLLGLYVGRCLQPSFTKSLQSSRENIQLFKIRFLFLAPFYIPRCGFGSVTLIKKVSNGAAAPWITYKCLVRNVHAGQTYNLRLIHSVNKIQTRFSSVEKQVSGKGGWIFIPFETRQYGMVPTTTKLYFTYGITRIRIHFIRIRIQHFRLNTDPDPDPIRIRIRGFNDKKIKKLQLKKNYIFFWSKTTITYP